MNRHFATKLYAFLAIFFWAASFSSTKFLLSHEKLSPMDLAVLRYFFAGTTLLLILVFSKQRWPKLKDFGKFSLAAILGFTAYMFFFNTAIQQINSSTASVINASSPGITALFAFFCFQERISWKGVLGLLLSFVGILILSLWQGKLSINIGVLYMIAAALCLSAYNISQRMFVKEYKAFEVLSYSMILGSIYLILLHSKSFQILPKLSLVAYAHLIFLAIFPSIVSYYCWTKALSCAEKTAEVTNFMFLTPILASLMSFLWIGEFPSGVTYIGGACILLGMLLFQKEKNS